MTTYTLAADSRIARRLVTFAAVALGVLLSGPVSAAAQVFNSGFDPAKSDGALDLTGKTGVVVYDPDDSSVCPAPPCDADADGIFHFTSVTIPAGVTLRLKPPSLVSPVFWLVQGQVKIDGIVDLSGDSGQRGQDISNPGARSAAQPGPGGFAGGLGGVPGSSASAAQPGGGPGGGRIVGNAGGGGGGYGTQGGNSADSDGCGGSPGGGAGTPYGNIFAVPLVGGSGGGGGAAYSNLPGGGGGGGGGALLIASSTAIEVNGTIIAGGGKGGDSDRLAGGGGSGGAIRLVAPTVSGSVSAVLNAAGGVGGTGINSNGCYYVWNYVHGHGGPGAVGRIRVETFTNQFRGTTNPEPERATPYAVFAPTTPPSSLKVLRVAGQALVNPSGGFTPADVQINSGAAVPVEVEAHNVPLQTGTPPAATKVTLVVVSENAPDMFLEQELSGDDTLSTATFSVTFPSGFSRAFVHARWARSQ